VLDLLRQYPSASRIAPDDFVSALSPLAPRLYSISSSLLAHPQQVHLTVGAVRYTNDGGRACKGVASTFLADRVRPGMRLRVFLHPSHKFGLCDASRPIVMVGPGTGVAPFRAFLQERAASKASGKSWLLFGDQRSDQDFLYRDELERYRADGVLARLDTAFSRDQAEKVYVQHRMLEHAAELWKWLEEGAAFYVCGDAQRMASDVDRALRQVIMTGGNMTAAVADRYVSDMVRAGRYQRDVY
jgi:sulfite reductase (NADPH) flavoprotein alpha-component